MSLLNADEPPAATVREPPDPSPFVVLCDHASRRMPRALGTLDLSPEQLCSHIAWDIGAAAVADRLATRLKASLIVQNYSRLVIDCNRPSGAPNSIPIQSERVHIPRNAQLPPAEVAARRAEIFEPYHRQIDAMLERRRQLGIASVLIAVHSFVPVFLGVGRPWQIGLMYRRDARLATALLRLLRQDETLQVGDNQPYAMDDTDYTLPHHGERRGLPHIGIELRHDLIADAAGQRLWTGRLGDLLEAALRQLPAS